MEICKFHSRLSLSIVLNEETFPARASAIAKFLANSLKAAKVFGARKEKKERNEEKLRSQKSFSGILI
jgi:hypothetical protein